MNKPRLKDVNYLPCGYTASRWWVRERERELKYDSNSQSPCIILHDLPAMILIIKGHSRNTDPGWKRPVLHQSLAFASPWHAFNPSKATNLVSFSREQSIIICCLGTQSQKRNNLSPNRTPCMDQTPRWARPTWSLSTLKWWKWAGAQKETHNLLKWDSSLFSNHRFNFSS